VPGPSQSAAEADAEVIAAVEDEEAVEDEHSLAEDEGLFAVILK